MNTKPRTTSIAWSAMVLLAGTLGGCSHKNPEPPVAVVDFPDSGISLTPGKWWRTVNETNGTYLEGEGYFDGERISVFPPSGDCRDPESRASSIKSNLEAGAIEKSFSQDPFTTNDGHRGVHVSYLLNSQGPPQKLWEIHWYIITNSAGRCVAINHILDTHRGSDAMNHPSVVKGMVQSTLRLTR